MYKPVAEIVIVTSSYLNCVLFLKGENIASKKKFYILYHCNTMCSIFIDW